MCHYIPELRSICPDATTFHTPHCPQCGAEAETFYRDWTGETLGCSECLIPINADEYFEE